MNAGAAYDRGFRRRTRHSSLLTAAILLAIGAAWAAMARRAPVQEAAGGDFKGMAQSMPPGEPAGERPYEMVRAGRKPPHVPLVDFDSLRGWEIVGRKGGRGALIESRRQRVWESPVARLVYLGTSKESEVEIRPPKPIPIPEPYTAVTLWVYGNNWGWTPDPKTPPTDLQVLLEDAGGRALAVDLDKVRWKEWWYVHRVLPPEVLSRRPLAFRGIAVKGCGNTEDRELYFEDLVFMDERMRPLAFEARPKRPIEPLPGQPQGANTGPGKLPFPTREETILPENLTAGYKTSAGRAGDGIRLRYEGPDATLEYLVGSRQPYFRDIEVSLNGRRIATVWSEAGPDFGAPAARVEQTDFSEAGGTVRGAWKVLLDSGPAEVKMAARLWQKSLVIDVLCPDGSARELSYGWIRGVESPELILLPFLNYGNHHLHVLSGRSAGGFFSSVWMDWYRSNASEPYAVDRIDGASVRLNGGVLRVLRVQPEGGKKTGAGEWAREAGLAAGYRFR